jgi:dienelactone hydrolase
LTVTALLLLPTPLVAQSTNPSAPATPAAVSADSLRPRVQTALQRAELAPYRGWLKFLSYEADAAVKRSGPDGALAREKAARLADWLQRIEADPALLGKLRGVQEWAYESPVDNNGQPFKLNIPTDYDPARPAALSVYMHGYSGNHLEHSTGMQPHTGSFELSVLGRGRGVRYFGLAEADVLQAIDYVQSHWRIDPDRVHLNGGSMGGGATLRLGSRYPHRFASGQPVCGFGIDLPVANLLTFPIYATHSDDDWTVPVVLARPLLARLRQLGGQAIFDETNGFGHAAWNYTAGNERGNAWASRQVRPDSRTVRRLDFTALDGGAARAWWAEIVEWGPEPKPARFILLAASDHTLQAELFNLSRLRLRLAESPFDRAQPLRVSVNGAVPFEIAPPLPESVMLAARDGAWQIETSSPPAPFRLHSPGGPLLLYDGSPLLIVHGTRGDAAAGQAMRAAAEAASKSANPGWVTDGGEAGADGVPHHQLLYGRLNVKTDREVTDADLQRCHLVLIGAASQNTLVARLADRLPVQLADGRISCSDGEQSQATNRVMGLVHYNPLSPQRLIFWVASDNPAAYAPGNLIAALGGRAFIGADLVIMDVGQPRLVATRRFDSHWHWNTDRAASPLLPSTLLSHAALARRTAEAIRLAAGADFAVAAPVGPASLDAFVSGTTRLADVLGFYYYEPISVFDVSGAELEEMNRRLSAANSGEQAMRFQPSLEKIDPRRSYRVAISAAHVSPFAGSTQTAPRSFRMTDLQVSEALERFLVPQP